MEKLFVWVFDTYGVFGMIILVMVFISFHFNKSIVEHIKTIFGKDIYLNNKPSKILKYKLTYWTDFKIPNIQIKDSGRKKIFVDFLEIKFEAMQKYLIEPLYKIDGKKIKQMDLSDKIISETAHAVEVYQKEAREFGIPEIVISRFEELHAASLERFHMNCSMILQSDGIYQGNVERIEAIYSLLVVLLELTIVDVERTLATINGELTGTEYKGVTCG